MATFVLRLISLPIAPSINVINICPPSRPGMGYILTNPKLIERIAIKYNNGSIPALAESPAT